MTNDLVSRKALIGMFEHHTWLFTSDIIKNINSAPALSQPNEPVAQVAQESFGRGNVFWYKECPPDGTDLFTAPPKLEAKVKELKSELLQLHKDDDLYCNEMETKIAELEAKNKELEKSTQILGDYNAVRDAHIAELTAKCEKMREALEYTQKELNMYGYIDDAKDRLYVFLREALEEIKCQD